MELLREYIDIAVSSKEQLNEAVALFEDLGNFKKVRPDFIKIFKDSKFVKKATDEYGKTVFGAGGLKKSVGQNSEFSTQLVKTGAAVIDALKQDAAVGFVIATGDAVADQVFAAFFTNKRVETKTDGTSEFDANTTKVLMVLDRAYLKANNPETFEKMKQNWDIFDGPTPVQLYDTPISLAKSRGYITAIIKAIKQADASAKLIIINRDVERDTKQRERSTAKRGRILTPKEYAQLSVKDLKNYANGFKSALKSRLDKYKSGKAIDVKSAEEFFNTILEKGYLDKIKLNGVTYEYYDTRLNFSKLKDGINDSFYTSAAEYHVKDDERFNWSGDGTRTQYQKLQDMAGEESGYYALRDKIKAAKDAGEDAGVTDEEKEKALDEYSKKCPPYRIYIKFKIQGASIVPDTIEFARN